VEGSKEGGGLEGEVIRRGGGSQKARSRGGVEGS
jgi:hypothetical protein